MQLPAIKKLVDNYTLDELRTAENALYEESPLAIQVDGHDEGEQLTHILAAIWVLEKMQSDNLPYKDAIRAYTQRVRTSIDGGA